MLMITAKFSCVLFFLKEILISFCRGPQPFVLFPSVVWPMYCVQSGSNYCAMCQAIMPIIEPAWYRLFPRRLPDCCECYYRPPYGCYFAPHTPGGVRGIAMSVSVCLSVCRLACLKNDMSKHYTIFCTYQLWPWLGLALTTMQYVMYFRFLWMTSCFQIVGPTARGVGNNDVGAVLKQLVNISNVFTTDARYMTLSSYTMAVNGAPWVKCDIYDCLLSKRLCRYQTQ